MPVQRDIKKMCDGFEGAHYAGDARGYRPACMARIYVCWTYPSRYLHEHGAAK